MNKKGISNMNKYERKDKETICPICGKTIEYTNDYVINTDNTSGYFSWKCPSCGASGNEKYIHRFNKHCDVIDKDNNLILP